MLDAMYNLPDNNRPGKKMVTEAVVEGKETLIAAKPRRRRESA